MVVKSDRIPVPGETILGGDFFINPGGKGANQAVAIARLGGNVLFISKIGDDIFGGQLLQNFKEEELVTAGLFIDHDTPTGVALITVDQKGENSIVVASGANSNLQPEEVGKILENTSDVGLILLQLEIPISAVRKGMEIAKEENIKVVLNPAPFHEEVSQYFAFVDVITPNTQEAEMLTGISIIDVDSAEKAARCLKEQGVERVVITMGEMGAFVLDDQVATFVKTQNVNVVDTTAAGDSFNGALAVALSEGKNLISAVKFANAAAAITVTRLGAQTALPFRNELSIE